METGERREREKMARKFTMVLVFWREKPGRCDAFLSELNLVWYVCVCVCVCVCVRVCDKYGKVKNFKFIISQCLRSITRRHVVMFKKSIKFNISD